MVILHFKFDSGSCLFAVYFVRANVLETVKFVQQDIFIPFSSTSIEGFVPGNKASAKRTTTPFKSHQELPARFVSCLVRGKICTFAAIAI